MHVWEQHMHMGTPLIRSGGSGKGGWHVLRIQDVHERRSVERS